MGTNYDQELYGKLLSATLPGPIETEDENERALAIVENIMRKGEENISPEESRLMQLFVFLIKDFEEAPCPMGEEKLAMPKCESSSDMGRM